MLPRQPAVPLGGWCTGSVSPPVATGSAVDFRGEQRCEKFGGVHELTVVLQAFVADARGGYWADARGVRPVRDVVSGAKTAAPHDRVACGAAGGDLLRTRGLATVHLEDGGTRHWDLTSAAVRVPCRPGLH